MENVLNLGTKVEVSYSGKITGIRVIPGTKEVVYTLRLDTPEGQAFSFVDVADYMLVEGERKEVGHE